ncbi:MAG: TolC family protein [Spirochaetota bacterium]
MKKVILFVILCLTVSSAELCYSQERKVLFLSLEEALSYARNNDLELKNLEFSFRELAGLKKNLYRSFFPSVSASLGRSRAVHVGELDTDNYYMGISLEQVIYDQLSLPVRVRRYGFSLKEAKVNIEKRKHVIKRDTTRLYLEMLLGRSKLENKKTEYQLYQDYLELMKQEYRLGMKTMLEVIEVEKTLLETQLQLEQLKEENRILYRDFLDILGLEQKACRVILDDDFKEIFFFLMNMEIKKTLRDVYLQFMDISSGLIDYKSLYAIAQRRDPEIKKLKLDLVQKSLQKKLLSIQFLNNVSLSYEIGFSGEKFPPVNTTHIVGINLLLDFGIISSDISLSGSSSRELRSRSEESEYRILESLDLLGAREQLRITTYTTRGELEKYKKDLLKKIKVWTIKSRAMLRQFEIKLKQMDIFRRNHEIMKLQLELGKVKRIDYTEFCIMRTRLVIELDQLKHDFVRLLWELEEILNIRLCELLAQEQHKATKDSEKLLHDIMH